MTFDSELCALALAKDYDALIRRAFRAVLRSTRRSYHDQAGSESAAREGIWLTARDWDATQTRFMRACIYRTLRVLRETRAHYDAGPIRLPARCTEALIRHAGATPDKPDWVEPTIWRWAQTAAHYAALGEHCIQRRSATDIEPMLGHFPDPLAILSAEQRVKRALARLPLREDRQRRLAILERWVWSGEPTAGLGDEFGVSRQHGNELARAAYEAVADEFGFDPHLKRAGSPTVRKTCRKR